VTTANDLILGALKRINAYAPGESLASDDAQDALDTLNELLDSWSTDQASVFASAENILTFTPGKYQYTIGNYVSSNFFTGTLVNGSPTISGVTIPADLILRADVTVNGTGLAPNTVVTGVGANTVTISPAATATVATPQVFNYTVPGDFKLPRPLRVTNSFTRITTQTSGLDYPIEIISQERYIEIGFKGISAPWPIVAWYNPTMPLANIYFYQNPSGAGELHLFTDTILTNLANLTQNVILPQGYVRMIKWNLARELAPEYGKTWTALMEKNAKDSWDAVKSLNNIPVPVAKYDTDLLMGRSTDAGWILYGGFR
jgi:hypothetical protein